MSSARVDLAWVDEATCAQIGDDLLWFPVKGGSTKDAKAICFGCPVRLACLEDAIAAGDWFAVRGGTSPKERRRIVRERSQQSPTTQEAEEVAA